MEFGVIGGTGFCGDDQAGRERLEVETPYGKTSVYRVSMGGAEVAFLPRHGVGHSVPPHRVNYRANIAALRELGVTNILASAAVGSMAEGMPPGALGIVTQFLDFTRGRPGTFFDGEEGQVRHVDVSDPYCPRLRAELAAGGEALGQALAASAVYACTEGPRFETPAEIAMFRTLGAELVGMTSVPEVVLAREAGICYATVAVVTNWAAGVSGEPIKHEEVSAVMGEQIAKVRTLFEHVMAHHEDGGCACREWAEVG
jgi:5'-methylthioadenosine phosphorylase